MSKAVLSLDEEAEFVSVSHDRRRTQPIERTTKPPLIGRDVSWW
jgi:hypothetical protein